uniref:SCHIP-1 domain-containing protein n=1 Tax=Gongylonema pulchrum TaxID=637853 RepID=A0A183DTM2_9BILA
LFAGLRLGQGQLPPHQLLIAGPDGKTVSVGGEHSSADQVALILKQQHIINVLRSKMEQSSRENDRLKAIMDANMLIENLDKRTATRAYESQRLQVGSHFTYSYQLLL